MQYKCLLAMVLVLWLSIQLPASSDSTPIDNFSRMDAWTSDESGGSIQISAGIRTPDGKPSMRLSFAHGEFLWGNAVRSIALPPNTCGVDFDVLVERAVSGTTLFLWLMERDNDGRLAYASPEGKSLFALERGWHHCYLPISSFKYQPRGNGVNEILTTTKMMIGMNGGKGEICLANLAFRTVAPGGRMPECRSTDLRIQNGPNGRIAILRDNYSPAPGNADPKVLAGILERNGYGVTFLKSGDLADPSVLKTSNFDCVVFPYGPDYPNAAVASIKSYLKSGGSFFSMGGYALDRPCVPDSDGKLLPADGILTAAELAGGFSIEKYLNTRNGTYGDALGLQPDQIGVFDPCYHLNFVSEMRAASSQVILPASKRWRTKVTGYSACSLLGSNSPVFPKKWGRHIPIVQALDSFGRLRGDVGSIAQNYAGPYAGSSWAFFGVTDTDLFSENGPMLPYLPAIMDALLRKTFLHSLQTDLACYKDGETVRIECNVADLGRKEARTAVEFFIYDRSGKQVFASVPSNVSLQPGSTQQVSVEFTPGRFKSDLYRVQVTLKLDGKPVDSMETGFVAYDPKITAGGFKLQYKNNYFQNGNRSVLVSGTCHTGVVFGSANENPLVWDRDIARLNENGLSVLRVLHFALFQQEKPLWWRGVTELLLDRMPIRAERQLDGLVQLCQKHNIVLHLDVNSPSFPLDLSDEELGMQRRFAKQIADRYRNVPGLVLEVRDEPDIWVRKTVREDEFPHVFKGWNDYLQERYKTDEALKAAWRESPPEAQLGSIPYRSGAEAWSDLRTYDAESFRQTLIERSIDANCAGVREGNPNVLITAGLLQYLFQPDGRGCNKLLSVDKLDFANLHSYASINELRADVKLFDRRFEGKSVSIGEFGSFVDHDKRANGVDSASQDFGWFLRVGHYLFGLGGSYMTNWDMKEMDDCVFPWGIIYSCGGPVKTTFEAYRNQSLLFRQVKPEYRSPSVFLVVPIDQMMGGMRDKIVKALYCTVDSLFSTHVDFGVIDDLHLAKLPHSARVLIYPFPFYIPDDVYKTLGDFVTRGGRLLVSGDTSYDQLRRRTHTDRLEQLCGVRFISENYPNVGWNNEGEPCINVEPVGAQNSEGLYVNRQGQGEVYFSPKPVDDHLLETAVSLSADARDIRPTDAHVFRIYEQGGAVTYSLVNPNDDDRTVTISGAEGKTVEIVLSANHTGLARFDRHGNLLAVESQGPVKVNGRTIFDIKGHFAISSLDGRDLSSSQEMLVLPFGEGKLSAKSLNTGMTIQTGNVVDGKWHVLSQSESRSITASGATAFDIRIVAPNNRIGELGEYVASELMLKAEESPDRYAE